MALWHDVYRRQRASSIDGQKCDATGDATGRDTSGNAIGPGRDMGWRRADTVKGTRLEGVEQRAHLGADLLLVKRLELVVRRDLRAADEHRAHHEGLRAAVEGGHLCSWWVSQTVSR